MNIGILGMLGLVSFSDETKYSLKSLKYQFSSEPKGRLEVGPLKTIKLSLEVCQSLINLREGSLSLYHREILY